MDKKPLIGVSICVVVLLILGSLTNVVGYQTVQSSNQKVIKDEVSQKELLFQTIVDIANNKEIQRIILNSQISREGFFNPDMRFSVFNTHVLTKNQLKQIYIVGSMLSKIISKSRIQSMVKEYRFKNLELQQEISAVIEKNVVLKEKIAQLSASECDCENNSRNATWMFPIFCTFLFFLFILALALSFGSAGLLGQILGTIVGTIAGTLNCYWW